MSASPARARPLVYCSNRGHEQAQRLLPRGVVIETLVEEAIVRGDVKAGSNGGFVFLRKHGLVARCARVEGRVRPKPRAWAVLTIERDRRATKVGGVGSGSAPGDTNEGG